MQPVRQEENQQKPQTSEFEEKVININRVSKKTKGGNKIGFSALMVVGNHKGKVGVALGKARDTLSAIRKAARRARKRLIEVPMRGTTLPFPIRVKRGAAEVLLKPAPPGTGIIAGGAVRAVVEAAGIHDVVAKILGSTNQASNVYATFKALTKMQQIVQKIEQINLTKATKLEGKLKGLEEISKQKKEKPQETSSKKENKSRRIDNKQQSKKGRLG